LSGTPQSSAELRMQSAECVGSGARRSSTLHSALCTLH
jgi:hypothetical protein